jgi:hypothetical protein
MSRDDKSVKRQPLTGPLAGDSPAATNFYSQHPGIRIPAKLRKTNGLIFSNRDTFAISACRTVLRDARCGPIGDSQMCRPFGFAQGKRDAVPTAKPGPPRPRAPGQARSGALRRRRLFAWGSCLLHAGE